MSNPSFRRTFAFVVVILLVTGWVYAASLEWRGKRSAQRIASQELNVNEFDYLPLNAEPSRAAAQSLLTARSDDYPRINSLLEYSLVQRPLYAPYWVDRAEAAYEAGNSGAAEEFLDTAVSLWPNRHVLLWRTAMLRTRMGHAESALDTLRDYLRSDPNGYRKVLGVALRLRPDPAALLHKLLPERTNQHQSRDGVVWRILETAKTSDNPSLGIAAWRELSRQARRQPDMVTSYVEWMVAQGNQAEALAAWRTYRSTTEALTLENGGFEQRLGRGLGWRSWKREGVALDRDDQAAFTGRYAMRVTFSGEQNLHFSHLRQYIPVKPGTAYSLSFAWRGLDISTRSGPYVEVRARKGERLARTEGRWGTWEWRRHKLAFTAPDNARFVEVRLRRDRTDALDNKIRGELWLDEFRLSEATKEAQHG